MDVNVKHDNYLRIKVLFLSHFLCSGFKAAPSAAKRDKGTITQLTNTASERAPGLSHSLWRARRSLSCLLLSV